MVTYVTAETLFDLQVIIPYRAYFSRDLGLYFANFAVLGESRVFYGRDCGLRLITREK